MVIEESEAGVADIGRKKKKKKKRGWEKSRVERMDLKKKKRRRDRECLDLCA